MARLRLRLRPLALGFIMNPDDSAGLIQAIELASTLWGGGFFPIIPLLKRITGPLRYQVPRRITAQEMVAGYIDAFDPDILVKVGNVAVPPELAVSREIIGADEVNFPNLLKITHQSTELVRQSFSRGFRRRNSHFSATQHCEFYFRNLPAGTDFSRLSFWNITRPGFDSGSSRVASEECQSEPSCSLTNFVNFLNRDSFFPRRLMQNCLVGAPQRQR